VDISVFAWVATIVMGILSILFGTKYSSAKNKFLNILSTIADCAETLERAVSELRDIISTTKDALADNRLTEEEMREIVEKVEKFVATVESIKNKLRWLL